MTTTEACKLAGFSRQHIHRLLLRGFIEGVKLGHDWLVYEDSLSAYLARPRKRGPKGPHKTSAQGQDEMPSAESHDAHDSSSN
jgi:excisionase family DNA binding protein